MWMVESRSRRERATRPSAMTAGPQPWRKVQQSTRDDSQPNDEQKKNKNKRVAAAVIPAWGGALDSPWAIGIGASIVIGGTAWVLIQTGSPVKGPHE
jgi:hypothetical protein